MSPPPSGNPENPENRANHEDPARLLAEVEAARLAVQSRSRQSSRSILILALTLIFAIGGIILWLLAVTMDTLSQNPQNPRKAKPAPKQESKHESTGR